MSTTTPVMPRERLPQGAVRIRARGLLSNVWRPCPDHAGDCPCVARKAHAGCLIYWCAPGAHHFSIR